MDNECADPLSYARKAATKRNRDTRPDPDTWTQPVNEPRNGCIEHVLAALAVIEEKSVEKASGAARVSIRNVDVGQFVRLSVATSAHAVREPQQVWLECRKRALPSPARYVERWITISDREARLRDIVAVVCNALP